LTIFFSSFYETYIKKNIKNHSSNYYIKLFLLDVIFFTVNEKSTFRVIIKELKKKFDIKNNMFCIFKNSNTQIIKYFTIFAFLTDAPEKIVIVLFYIRSRVHMDTHALIYTLHVQEYAHVEIHLELLKYCAWKEDTT
jgi:hypothetical protein